MLHLIESLNHWKINGGKTKAHQLSKLLS